MNENEDLQREREKLELEKRRLELERERFAFEREKQAVNAPPTASQAAPLRRPVPISMWILGIAMLVANFLPWIEMRGNWNLGIAGKGSMILGEASGTNFWQGQLCIVLLIGAFVAKYFHLRAVAGICVLLIPLIAVQFVLQMQGMLGHSQSVSFMGMTASSSSHADPSVGSIALVILSIPFAILAFRRRNSTPVISDAAVPTAHPAKLPWPDIGIVALQLGMVALVVEMFGSSTRSNVSYVLLSAVIYMLISYKLKWGMAAQWTAILVGATATGWGIRLLLKFNQVLHSGYSTGQTGSVAKHVAIEFGHAFLSALPSVCLILIALVVYLSWQERLGRGVKRLSAILGGPRWRQMLLACSIVLGYPLVVSGIDATRLDVATHADRDRIKVQVDRLVSEEWRVYRPDDPARATSFSLAVMYEGKPSVVHFWDYGHGEASVSMKWDGRIELDASIRFKVKDEHLSDTLVFGNPNNRITLSAMRNDIINVRVENPDPHDSQSTITNEYLACRASMYAQRQGVLRSLEGKLQAHCTYLAPVQGQSITGQAITAAAIGTRGIAIAKDTLLAQDTVGVTGYRYEVAYSPLWVGLTDTTITLLHQIRFIAQSRAGSGELRSLRTYQSIFDTAGVLLSSVETDRMSESAPAQASDSTYMAEGVFVSAECNDECYVTFKIQNGSTTEERTLLYAVVSERVPLMSKGDGTGDFTNTALVGKKFMLMLRMTTLPYSVPEGMPPDMVESVVLVEPL